MRSNARDDDLRVPFVDRPIELSQAHSFGVIETLADVMLQKGVPDHVRCDNGPEMIAQALRQWLAKLGTKTLYIAPGSPWENGDCES